MVLYLSHAKTWKSAGGKGFMSTYSQSKPADTLANYIMVSHFRFQLSRTVSLLTTLDVVKLLHSPSKLLHSPSKLLHSPSKLLHSPSKLLHSPSKLLHSPSKLLHSPSSGLH